MASNDEKKGKSKATICGSCQEELEPDHSGIQCVQGHHFCPVCSQNIVTMFFSDPRSYTPLKCLQCNILLNVSVFERQLEPHQIEHYRTIMLTLVYAKDILTEGEELLHCSFCSYAEIRPKGTDFLYCRHEDCSKVSCLICLKECPKFEENYDDDEDEDEFQQKTDEMEKHFMCVQLKDDKKIIDDAIEQGQKLPCPQCGLAGMKDDGRQPFRIFDKKRSF
ncbi:unnamed protein product [Didymodactylos carnosus]|uniref:Uncharacterized protein n=1 Tax=Didymodactylos carnosus TaxID=1234261 RepID=A0A815CTG2_9BILA|nr:unnamed protein product [Didymodactylos carnosus]CAF4091603.1 unnamed protein product [Didymodactylos carnosus]